MKLVIFGATGMVGRYVVEKALRNGHTVRAFGRNVDKLLDKDSQTENLEAIKGYVFDEESVHKAIDGCDVVISVLGGAFDGSDHTRSLGMKNIVLQMQKSGVNKIIALGGLGVLTDAHNVLLLNNPNYPKQYIPVGKEHLAAFEYLKDSTLEWTFVCAPEIREEPATGAYHTNAEHVPSPDNGRITAEDLADFMLTLISTNNFNKVRVGISN